MRTLILVVATCFVLTLGYLAYWWTQPVHSKRISKADRNQAALPLTARETDKPYGPGKNVWIKKFDADTAKIASRFKANEYTPRNDGWVVVKQPRAQFFMKDGRAISVEGETGEVIMDDNKQGIKALSGSRDTPSRGRLYNVTIHLYHDVDRPEEQLDEEYLQSKKESDAPHLGMTITLNNASFDNQTFKIYSEGYGRGKNHVDADQVPVTLRGEDYDFDGRGLVIRWNERDRRLQLLEVAHGERLIIKHPNNVLKKDDSALAGGGALSGGWGDGEMGNVEGPLPVLLAAKNRAAVGEAIKSQPAAPATAPTALEGRAGRRARPGVPKPKITPNTDPPLYRAIFHDNVHIVQGPDLDVTAERMSVDFLMQDQSDDAATTKPTTRATKGGRVVGGVGGPTTAPTVVASVAGTNAATPTTQPTRAATAQGASAGKKSPRRAATTMPTTTVARRPRAAATTEPDASGEVPVVITWTGKLVVEPLAVGPENPIKDGDAVVRLEGKPVTATQQGSTIYSGTLTYRTEDQAMLLTPIAADQPVVMKDTKGSLVHTTRMDFFQQKHQAILYGASDALFPQESEDGKTSSPLLAKWTKTCTLYFASGQPQDDVAGGSATQPTTRPAQRGSGGGGAGAPGSMDIERAELEGDVFVDHPQLKLRSQALDLSFDTSKRGGAATRPTTRPAGNGKVAELDAAIAAAKAPFGGVDLEALVLSKGRTLQDVEKGTDERARKVAEKEFEDVQAALMRVQDLEAERKTAAAAQPHVALAASQPDAATRPVQVAAGAASQPTTRPAMRSDLKQLVATGAVHCEMTDSAKKTQTIDCVRLTMLTSTTPDGKIYPNTVNADGDVHAVDPDQDLRAGHLAVTLRPTTQPAKNASGDNANAELKSLIAHQDVKVVSKDGTITLSDQLLVDTKDGKNNVKLLGQPAQIIDKKSTLSGPIIEIFPDAQQLQIVGIGNMKGVQQEKPGDPERPIDVTWNRGMFYDGKANTVDVTGQVVAVTTDADGAKNTARGERMKMLLVDAGPTTRPTTQATTQTAATAATVRPAVVAVATTQGATSQPTTKPSRGQVGGMASKNVRQITFDENATVTSVTLADDQSLLRRTHLEAATVQYDMLLKKLLVPVPGRMIVEDHRPATTQPVAGGGTGTEARPAAASVDGSAENNRGSTAFEWSKQFTYEDVARQAVMTGDSVKPVVVVHRDDSPRAQLFRLTGETVTADLEEVPTTQPTSKPAVAQATTKPTTKPASEQAKVQLKRVTATGHLHFTGPGAEIYALYMEYDPRTHWLIARGNERERVNFTMASQPGGPKTAEELQYNLDTGDVRTTRMTIQMGK